MSQATFHLRFVFGLSLFIPSLNLNADTGRVNFSRDIRPILSDRCFQCHGPDEAKQKSGLRLDLHEDAIAAADSGSIAIVPNRPEASELVKRILSKDADEVMPPSDSPKKLTESEIELLRKWISEGANYEVHWAFTPPTRPVVPAVDAGISNDWLHNPVDRFLRANLRQAGINPNPTASKETLIRRVALDLTGLPPTPAQIEKYLADKSDSAYENMVDQFFTSPHYGERMALNWLDYARYADSNGYQSDGSRDIWGWRDWVIKAYNQNMPFDQFTVEQLAGDMLPSATPEQIIATGFNRNHRLNGEGGRIVEEWFVETVIDRVETTGLTWLGLTFNCCRCHDHKYDPISQKEFYQIFAFFNSVEEEGVLVPSGKNGENTPPLFTMKSEAHQAEIARREVEVGSMDAELQAIKAKLPEFTDAWAAKNRGEPTATISTWQHVQPIEVVSAGGATLAHQEDGSYLASGANPANDAYTVTIATTEESISGVLLEVMPDVSLPNQSLGRGFNGNFVMTDFTVELVGGPLKKPRPVKLVRTEADFAQDGWPAANVLENTQKSKKPLKGWAIEGNNPERRIARKILFAADQPAKIPNGASIQVRFGNRSEYSDHNVGRFRLSITSAAPEQVTLGESGMPANVAEAIKKETDQWSDSDRQAIEGYYLASVPNPIRASESKVTASRKSMTDYIDDLPTTMVMKEAKPRDAFILVRGEYDKPGAKVDRAVPAVLPSLPQDSPVDRLGLAKWIVGRNNPLTARVWVNREWERFFGMGIVKTTENLGSQAEYPVNAELLDWLAVEFMEPTLLPPVNGQTPRPWDMKSLQKLISRSRRN